jgi:hypothetical protein
VQAALAEVAGADETASPGSTSAPKSNAFNMANLSV